MVSKSYSISLLNAGIIEDVDISKIVSSPRFYPSIPTNLNELSESIRKKGLLQAIIVRTKQGHYEIVAGNRRYLACKKPGCRKILCHIVELDDREAFEISLIENIQRRTINPIEEAHAFRNYISNYGWGSISELAARIGKSVSYVDKRIRLLTLPNSVLEKVTGSLLNVSTVARTKKKLLKEQQKRVAARFPTKIQLSTEQRIDRLEACTATYLAFMDRMLEFWEVGVSPFALPHPKPIKKSEPQPAVIE